MGEAHTAQQVFLYGGEELADNVSHRKRFVPVSGEAHIKRVSLHISCRGSSHKTCCNTPLPSSWEPLAAKLCGEQPVRHSKSDLFFARDLTRSDRRKGNRAQTKTENALAVFQNLKRKHHFSSKIQCARQSARLVQGSSASKSAARWPVDPWTRDPLTYCWRPKLSYTRGGLPPPLGPPLINRGSTPINGGNILINMGSTQLIGVVPPLNRGTTPI